MDDHDLVLKPMVTCGTPMTYISVVGGDGDAGWRFASKIEEKLSEKQLRIQWLVVDHVTQ